jgi:hypothetical protein
LSPTSFIFLELQLYRNFKKLADLRLFGLIIVFITISGALQSCALVAAYPVTAASVATTAGTGKSPTDHAISESADQDCSIGKILDGQPICERRLKPKDVPIQDYSRKQRVVPAQ